MSEVPSTDQQFIGRLREIVLANLSNENFDVEELAREARISRSSVHRRLKRVTNQNATHFIREIRLNKALEMLQNDLSTAAEVAYKVGFGSPAYFTKCFHEHYGHPPGEVRKFLRKEATVNQDSSREVKESAGKEKPSGRKLIFILPAVAALIIALVLLLIIVLRH